jgi:hypothetical protein
MKKYPIIIILTILFTGCDKFLDVQPFDKVVQTQVINSEHQINMVLNGIYMNMTSELLYGRNLSTTLIEALAQRYNVNNVEKTEHYFTGYNFEHESAERAISEIWQGLYTQALNINDFLSILERTTAISNPEHTKWLRGEALALRAFHHFDILRLWGPSPAQPDYVPFMTYNDLHTGQQLPFLTADSILTRIEEDLTEAEALLRTDRIFSEGINTQVTFDDIRDFYLRRNRRMNWFAVKALQARVYLWSGKKAEALQAAMDVVEHPMLKSGQLFPWANPNYITTSNNPDRVFSSEIIFGVRNRPMYTVFNNSFVRSLTASNILAPLRERRDELYRSSTGFGNSDLRLLELWENAGGGDGVAFLKYEPPNNRNLEARAEYLQPLIRKSELYYIIAECIDDPLEGWRYLNTARSARNVIDLNNPPAFPGALAFQNEIMQEYQKEFFGEGQLYFYYKRLGITSIANARQATGFVAMPLRLPASRTEIERR